MQIEAAWKELPPLQQEAVFHHLEGLQKKDWKDLTLEEKKACPLSSLTTSCPVTIAVDMTGGSLLCLVWPSRPSRALARPRIDPEAVRRHRRRPGRLGRRLWHHPISRSVPSPRSNSVGQKADGATGSAGPAADHDEGVAGGVDGAGKGAKDGASTLMPLALTII